MNTDYSNVWPINGKRSGMLEKTIERRIGEYAHKNKVAYYKFTSPNHAAVPDRILLAPIPEFLRDLIAMHIRFVEVKRTGAKATKQQEREHERLRALGFTVHVVDDIEAGKRIINEMTGAGP